MSKSMSIGEFAKLTGVSQRTLRFYEEKGLLMPSYTSESGRRYYSDENLFPLQQILAFKYLGFSLEKIQILMSGHTVSLTESLLLQRTAMEQKREHINQIIKAIDHATEVLHTDDSIDPQIVSFLIHSIVTEPEQMEWMTRNLPEGAVTLLRQQFADRDKELEYNKRSTVLLQRMKRAIGEHAPESEAVQSIIDELYTLLVELFGDDLTALQQSIEQIEEAEIPDVFSTPFNAEEDGKLAAAFEYYMISKGMLPDEPQSKS